MIDGISFFASAAFISAITLSTTPGTRKLGRTVGSVFAEYFTGLRWLCGHPNLFLISLHKAMLMAFCSLVPASVWASWIMTSKGSKGEAPAR